MHGACMLSIAVAADRTERFGADQLRETNNRVQR